MISRSQRWRDEMRKVDKRNRRHKATDAFDVSIDEDQERTLVNWLCNEIEAAYDARSPIIMPHGEIDYYHWLYEQGRSPQESLKWKGAADLGSPIITEKVDAWRARIVRTIFQEPVWVVEGWGEDAKKAPFVEEFHQWKVEDERLQGYLSKGIHNGLVEGTGILEVIDRHEARMVHRVERLAAKVSEQGLAILDEKNLPVPDVDEQGIPKPAVDGLPMLEAKVSKIERTRTGPGYRIISLRDFLFLPGHAADKAELFGYAKRCWKRVPELEQAQKQGVYRNVNLLSQSSDRDTTNPSLERQGQTIAEQRERTAEKELWEILFLHDLDEDGVEEWYLATVSIQHRQLLRLKHDDLGIPRYIDLTPFPRPDSLYGYTLAQKLASIAEEHAARRNQIADRFTLATSAPILRVQGALWKPQAQPFGPGQVLDVRDPKELTPMLIPDVPASAPLMLQEPINAAERVGGLSDLSSGATTEDDKTLGERRMQVGASEIRIDEVIKNIQEALEPLWTIRNEIWIRTLATQKDGLEPPEGVKRNLELKSLHHEAFQGTFTADILRGNLRGKPRGSVETADKMRQLQAWNGWLQALTGLAQVNPIFAQILQHPQVAKSLLEQGARLYNVPDRQVFMQAANEVMQAMAQQAQMQQMVEMAGAGIPPEGMEQAVPAGPPDLLSGLPPELQQLLSGGGTPPGVM